MRLDENLRARTKAFASSVIRIYIRLPRKREEVDVLGKQMLRSGTSVASHAREASRARSDSEFCSKLDELLQEADETQLWFELLIEDCNIQDTELPATHAEAGELLAIFTTIVSKVRKNL
jgi:four helix bundle protein